MVCVWFPSLARCPSGRRMPHRPLTTFPSCNGTGFLKCEGRKNELWKPGLPRDGFGFVERLSKESRFPFEQYRELAFDQCANLRDGFERISVEVGRFHLQPIQHQRGDGFHDKTTGLVVVQLVKFTVKKNCGQAGTGSASLTPRISKVPRSASSNTSRLFWMRASVSRPWK